MDYQPLNTKNANGISLSEFIHLNLDELERIYSSIEDKTWRSSVPLQRGEEADITFNCEYLSEVTEGKELENISIQEFAKYYLGSGIEEFPSIFNPLEKGMLCSDGEKINATKISLSDDELGVISEIP
ncbi:MAG: hypothetical protein AAGE99_02045, partial [Chlamydiota bacterium]